VYLRVARFSLYCAQEPALHPVWQSQFAMGD
jgi:hypothetical protein